MVKLGLIGWPLTYSLSPTIHTQWLKENKIEGQYEAWPVAPPQVSAFIKQLHETGIQGCNVTIPHKCAVMDLMDECSEEAIEVGAVNTICFLQNGRKKGHNTDIVGFKNDLAKQRDSDQAPKKVLLIGAGGAACAVQSSLRSAFPAVELLITARKKPLDKNQNYVPWEQRQSVLPDVDLIINATPLGKSDASELGLAWDGIKEGTFFYDLNYHAEETALVHMARKHGLRASDGLGMLVGQAQEAFRLWTGVLPKVDKDFLLFVRNKTKK